MIHVQPLKQGDKNPRNIQRQLVRTTNISQASVSNPRCEVYLLELDLKQAQLGVHQGLLVLFTQPFVFGGKRAPETRLDFIVTMGARDAFPIFYLWFKVRRRWGNFVIGVWLLTKTPTR